MLNPADHAKIQAAQEQALELLGSPVEWRQTKAPNAIKTVTAGIKTVGFRDQELVNAFGIGTVLLTIKTTDLPDAEKFDSFVIDGKRYTAHEVYPIHINAVHVFQKVICKGR